MGRPQGLSHLLLSVMGAFARFERDLIRERQREGIALAKLRGRVICWPEALVDARSSEGAVSPRRGR